MQNRRVSAAALAATGLAATALLSACGSSAGAGSSDSGTTTGTSGPTTPTVTVTVMATAPSTLPTPTLSKPGKPNTTMSTPPPAKDPLVIPDNPQAYAQAFVAAWVDRDRPRAAKLATATAVETAFASTVKTAPTFTRCEGAAGSTYCTWEGDEYTMTVRVGNELVAQRQEQAVREVRFAH
ncbi:MAG: hypothetical protein ABIO48_17415 [Pedococcus sp.]